ncbi:MAG: hypothetical protein EXS08_12075 [Planctomycetes bacterium]|nr:hypothetical protein [Planctomycetota bacterium]
MRKSTPWFVVGGLALVAVWWLLFGLNSGPSPSEQFAALRAAGVMFTPLERCTAYRPSTQDLTVWSAHLREAEGRLSPRETNFPLQELEQDPFAFWRAKDWALDDASWTSADAHLELLAEDCGELADLFRTIGDYRTLDVCEVYAKVPSSEFHPTLDAVRIFGGSRAIALSLLRCARRGELDGVQRDLEAHLLVAEKLQIPVSLIYFLAWTTVLDGALSALKGSLPLLDGRLDPAALELRLTAFQPRALLGAALTWERSNSLRMVEWSLDNVPHTGLDILWQRFTWTPSRDLAALTEGYELGLRQVRGEGVSAADLGRFEAGITSRMPLTSATWSALRQQVEVLNSLEARLALARSALRLLAHGHSGWEGVPRELDPYTGAPLIVEALDERRLRLRALKPGVQPEEQRRFEWTVTFR